MPRTQKWTAQQLIDAVDTSTSFRQVCQRLGLHPGGGTYRSLKRHMARLELAILHLERGEGAYGDARRRGWTDDDLRAVVADSCSFSEVARRLGYTVSGGAHRFVKQHIARLGLDTDHFVGQAWSRGRRFKNRQARPLSEILHAGSSYNAARLRQRLIAEGLRPAHCEVCGRSTWFGHRLPLELDHVNEDHTDNRLNNLRILCPNCHAVTETWCDQRGRRSPNR